ncbi:MAG: TolB family protein, partial [Thermoanaerobaculia bacterium]
MRYPFAVLCLAAAFAGPLAAAPEEPPRLTVEAALATDATGRRPAQVAWSPDGKRLTYLWDEAGDGKERALWSLDPETGRREVLARLADLALPRTDETDEKVELDEYAWSPKGDSLLLVSKGDLYLLPLGSRKLRRLTETDAEEEAARFSPDGRRVAFVRSFDLYVVDAATGKESRLTRDGRENETLNATN